MAAQVLSGAGGSTQRFAFVTLVTTDSYLPGALVLAHSLRQAHSTANKPAGTLTPADLANLGTAGLSNRTSSDKKADLVCLVTPATVSVRTVKTLVRYFDKIVGVEPLSFASLAAAKANERGNSRDRHTVEAKAARRVRAETRKKLALLGRPDLGEGLGASLTKLHAWRLTGYDKIIYLDADILVLRPIAHLFSISSSLAASPDIGWPDAFNSGLLVLSPSLSTFSDMRDFAVQRGSWDGADQGLLNDYFGGEIGGTDVGPGGGWQRLPFRYNVTPNAGYTFAPAYQRYGAGIMTAHFIGQYKPWNRPKSSTPPSSSATSAPADHDTLLYRWHEAFEQCYPQVVRLNKGLAEVVHTERGVEVVERPFSVPSYKAVWNMEGELTSFGSGDQLAPSSSKRTSQRYRRQRAPSASSIFRGAGQAEDLKEMFSPAIVAASAAAELETLTREASATPNEGIYISLPLDSRTSLMAAQLDSGDEDDRSSDSERTIKRSPSDTTGFVSNFRSHEAAQQDQNNSTGSGEWSPPKVSWDPASGPPPVGGGISEYQMREPVDTFYVNAWDQPISSQRKGKEAFFDGTQRSTSQTRTLSRLQREHFFDNLGSEEPDVRKVKAVFPWETNTGHAPSSRIFPDEDPASVVPGSRDMAASLQAGSSPAPGVGSSASVEMAERQGEQGHGKGFPSTLNYTNAWDQVKAIARRKLRAEGDGNGGNSRGNQAQSESAHHTVQSSSNRGQARTSAQAGTSSNLGYDPRYIGMHQGDHDVSADQSGDGDNESSSSSDEEVERGGTSWRREGPGRGYQRKVETHQLGSSLPRSPRHGHKSLGTSPSTYHVSHHASLGPSTALGAIESSRSRSSSNASNSQHASIPAVGGIRGSRLRPDTSPLGEAEGVLRAYDPSLSMPYEHLLASYDQATRRRMGMRTPTASQPGSATNSGGSSPTWAMSTPVNMSPSASRSDLAQLSGRSNPPQIDSSYNSGSRSSRRAGRRPYV